MSDGGGAPWSPVSELHRAVRDHLSSVLPGEGLRERKKRLMRQQISGTATALFLERGFDEVRVSEVAAACGVSEKTVFNYFPTKEALLLDREEGMAADLRRALGPDSGGRSPVDALVELLAREASEITAALEAPDGIEWHQLRRFVELLDSTPSLRAATNDMIQRLTQVAAEAMAGRAGVNPEDPEPQIAADSLLGLWRIYWRSIFRHCDGTRSPAEVRGLVVTDVTRAARLIDTGLWSFGMVVRGADGRHQLQTAAEAADQARKQVLVAIRQAREAWRLIRDEAHDRDGRDAPPGGDKEREREAREALVQARRQMQEAARQVRDASRQVKADARQAKAEVKSAARQVRSEATQVRADARTAPRRSRDDARRAGPAGRPGPAERA